MPGITPRRKPNYPIPGSDVISITSQNDTRIKPKFAKVDEEFKESHNGYRMEMKAITDDAIQQIEELAISNACPGGGIDMQNTISRIGIIICFRQILLYFYLFLKYFNGDISLRSRTILLCSCF